MASTLPTFQSFRCAFSPKSQFLSNPFTISRVSTFSSPQITLSLKHNHLPGSTSQGAPTDLIEDSKFVLLNPDDPTFGPPAMLLLGFEVGEFVKTIDGLMMALDDLYPGQGNGIQRKQVIQQLLKEMEGEFLEIIFCTEDMISQSLWEAMNTKQPNLEAAKIAKSVPRICFLSGLTGEETMMFIDAFPESGLEPAVFAALVPNSADKPVAELIEEIMGDHEMMSSRQSG